MAEADAPFFWGSGGERLSPDAIKRRRAMAQAMMKSGSDYSPVQHWTQGLARVAQALAGGYEDRQLDKAEKSNTAEGTKATTSMLDALLGGGGAATVADAAAIPAATASAATAPVAAPADLAPRFAQAEAQYGLPSGYLPQVAKIESSFNPNAANPNSSARGLFQFTKGTARDYGLANPMDPVASTDAAARLAADNAKLLTRALGRAPTAGELYLAHQQGGGGASKLLANPNARAVDIVGADAVRLNGGNANMTAGEFARKWTSKLAANEADMPAPDAATAGLAGPGGGFAVPPGEQPAPLPMSANNFNAISNGQPLDPAFQSEGVSQPWMGSTLQPQAPAGPQMAQAPLPPARPADLAMAQADVPAPGATEAIGRAPVAIPPDLTTPENAGALQFAVQQGEARQGQPSGAGAASPFAAVAQALGASGGAPQAAAASPAVAQVAQAMAQSPNAALAEMLNDPSVSPAAKQIAGLIVQRRLEAQQRPQWTEQRLDDGSIAQRNSQTGEVKVIRPGVDPLVREGQQLDVEAKRKALNETKPPPTLKVKQADGSEVTLEWDSKAGTYVPLRAPQGGAAVGPAPTNPYALPGKPTESQSKDAGFAGRMVESHNLINDLESVGVDRKQTALGAVPVFGNMLSSSDKQRFEQAKRNFVTATLRKESGAAISPTEFETEEKKYFPQVGDSPANIEQKRRARELAIEGVFAGAGAGYKVPESYKPGAKKAPDADAPSPPAGIDATTWKFMTPEERALWK